MSFSSIIFGHLKPTVFAIKYWGRLLVKLTHAVGRAAEWPPCPLPQRIYRRVRALRNPHPEDPLPDPYGANRAAPSAADPYGVGAGRAMELPRKSSLADGGALSVVERGRVRLPRGGGSTPPPGAGYGPGPAGQNGSGSYGSPPPGAGPAGRGRGQLREASLPPQQIQGTPGAGRGYALSDAGSRPGSAAGSMASTGRGGGGGGGAGERAQGTPPLRRPGAANNPGGAAGGGGGGAAGGGGVNGHPGTGPATFAEMGFTGAKAEDKGCVIM
ncbi:hypothetical protein B0H14DRAFT_2613243 [Mycena olivaceomarginata]|nr:hypothetical protein B0H14DRAFT_2613243 [Mycena olivaceomarginata]